jgi:hypothetical protein
MAAGNSNARVFWIIWCCGWAFFWFVIGFFSFGLAWVMVPVSLIAILIPVGVDRSPPAVWYGQGPLQYGQPPPTAYGQHSGPPPGGSRWWDGTKWTEHSDPPRWPPPSESQASP